MSTPTPLVLGRLGTVLPIVDPETGVPIPSFVQTLNNGWANISTAFAALEAAQALQAETVAQIVELNGLLTTAQAQVSAILAERQVGVIAATVVVGTRVRATVS